MWGRVWTRTGSKAGFGAGAGYVAMPGFGSGDGSGPEAVSGAGNVVEAGSGPGLFKVPGPALLKYFKSEKYLYASVFMPIIFYIDHIHKK